MSTELVVTETEIEGVTKLEPEPKPARRWLYLKGGILTSNSVDGAGPVFMCGRCLVYRSHRAETLLCSCGGNLRRLYMENGQMRSAPSGEV